MLRRQSQMRMNFHQLVDAGLFAASFWLAYSLRAHPAVSSILVGSKSLENLRRNIELYGQEVDDDMLARAVAAAR